ncbi:MAG: class I SAM-dependent methyltransferase [Verrucomicrobia bacterium]|nr:class I SAM-dependent methyltransferase [Verrucomicrobiota bacterium]
MENCVLFEDQHLLIVNKPAGINTHRPDPYTTDGIYDWFRKTPGRADLSTLHRLDKETSGILVFGKTTLANQSLTDQFAKRKVKKTYLLLTDRLETFARSEKDSFIVRGQIIRDGNSYHARELNIPSSPSKTRRIPDLAETHFKIVEKGRHCILLEAHPLTGRTHQIRIHAAWKGFPILGDELYGGTSFGGGLCLHAFQIEFIHPATGEPLCFKVPAPFSTENAWGIAKRAVQTRNAFYSPDDQTNAYRLFHGSSDGFPGVYMDKLADRLLFSTAGSLTNSKQSSQIQHLAKAVLAESKATSLWQKTLLKQPGKNSLQESSAQLILSNQKTQEQTADFAILENGIKYKLSFSEGYSFGIFLDQRENRRRILNRSLSPDFPLCGSNLNEPLELLNAFAYTCAFSVCGAKAGFHTTSLDLSRKYLEWGKENMNLNGINPSEHDFIYGDVFTWRKRLKNKGRLFDLVILDPPTFSRSKESGTFKAERDLPRLSREWSELVKPNGFMLISTNCATLPPRTFEKTLLQTLNSNRRVLRSFFATQPIDFPASSEEKAYLKTLWVQLS